MTHSQDILMACLPWLGLLAAALVVARLLVWASNAKLNWRRGLELNRCQEGSVQSLSFVLTLPFFIMIMMLIVQVSQIMIANVMVHYAAFASARSAIVWIPANVDPVLETANRISSFEMVEQTSEGTRYRVAQTGEKYSKIKQAAVIAIATMSPSRDLGYQFQDENELTSSALAKVYAGLDADSNSNTLIGNRLRNKLAFTYPNTDVQIEFWHRYGPFPNRQDPPLQVRYDVGPYNDEFFPNEVGWQDEISATVVYNLPLLPGPVRFFGSSVDQVAGETTSSTGCGTDISESAFVFPIAATTTLVNEGEKPVIAYWQEEFAEGTCDHEDDDEEGTEGEPAFTGVPRQLDRGYLDPSNGTGQRGAL